VAVTSAADIYPIKSWQPTPEEVQEEFAFSYPFD
jgi:hypothetical protein